jgi:hypothetical protein
MSRSFTRHVSAVGKALLFASVGLLVLLAFYWDFGVEPFMVKSIYTLDTGLLKLTVAPEFCLFFVAVFMFFVGYRLYVVGGRKVRVSAIETKRGMMAKFVLAVVLGVVGALLIYNEFVDARIWAYHIPDYAKIAKGSFAFEINALFALLLLVVWFLVIEVRIRRM